MCLDSPRFVTEMYRRHGCIMFLSRVRFSLTSRLYKVAEDTGRCSDGNIFVRVHFLFNFFYNLELGIKRSYEKRLMLWSVFTIPKTA